MNKCWFVLEQSFFTAPQYATLSRAGGKAEGDLRFGDVVPSPKDLYPVLTQGTLPLFSPEMRISLSKVCKFTWEAITGHEGEATIGGGAPIAAAAGITVNAELKTTFKRTMKNWAQFETLDTEIVQPTKAYINQILEKEPVRDHVDQQKIPLLNQWTIYMITGLMIARVGGTIGHSESSSTGYAGGPDLDVLSIAKAKLNASFTHNSETTISSETQGDRIWAIRLAKIHKGLLRPRWQQTEVTIGAALGGDREEEEKVGEVLQQEGITDFKIIEAAANDGEFVFVTGVTKDTKGHP